MRNYLVDEMVEIREGMQGLNVILMTNNRVNYSTVEKQAQRHRSMNQSENYATN